MTQWLYIGIDIICIISLFAISFLTLFGMEQKNSLLRFRSLLLATIVWVSLDAVWGFMEADVITMDGKGQLWFYAFYLGAVLLAMHRWASYIAQVMNIGFIENKVIRKIIWVLTVLLVLFIIVSAQSGLIYDLHGDIVLKNPIVFLVVITLGYAYPILEAFYSLTRIFRKRYRIEKRRSISISILVFYPLVFSLLHYATREFPFLSLGLTLAIVQVYLYIQSFEQEQYANISIIKSYNRLFLGTYYANIEENTCKLITAIDSAKFPYQEDGSYDRVMESFVETFVLEDDKANMKKMCAREMLRERLTQENPFYTVDYRRDFREEGYKWYRVHIILCSETKSGEPRHVVLSIMDVDAERRKEIEYQKSLEHANQAKSDFLSHMSHDIRTPMNAIVGYAALLGQNADKVDKVKNYTQKIQASSQHLLGLINDVLDMSVIEKGNVKITESKFAIAELIQEIVDIIKPLAESKEQKFDIHSYGVDECMVTGDKTRIRQILLNLLSNSVKYTQQEGCIILTISKDIKDDNRLWFEVRDNGIGMSEEFMQTMFEPFTREDNSSTRTVQGTGLGMAITKKLVDMMEGTIQAESYQGAGTIMKVSLQVKLHMPEKVQIQQATQTTKWNQTFRGKCFLVAEDYAENIEIITEILAIDGAQCRVAINGSEAVKTFTESENGEFDLILMDIQMPMMNGYEATKMIRACSHPQAKTIPIIALTADAFEEDVRKAINAGMNAHIPKPIDLNTLRTTIAKFL